VLRLMAAVIHCLWEKGDRNPLILPANIPIDDARVQFELTRYLSDNWVPVIEKDVDGPNSLPLRMDGEVPNLGKFAACRRVARTIYLGSAPLSAAAHRGLEDRRVKLGCMMPGETSAVFGDALRRLAGAATYLYQDGQRYWYSIQPTVTKLAEDRAEQLKREPDKVAQEIEKRLRADLSTRGAFSKIHPMPQSGADVPDDYDARLVVLGTQQPYSKDASSLAETAAKAILEFRGNTPRLFQNTLVFLAADRTRLQDLDEAARRFLAWESILAEKAALEMTPQMVSQAETQRQSADSTVTARLPETYQWLLVPVQATPQSPVTFQAERLTGSEALAERATKKLKNAELLLTGMAGTRLMIDLEKVPLWRGEHVAVRQLAEDFARYIYLPRLKDSSVLAEAVRDGVGLLTWERESFAFADGYDETEKRYRGLRTGQAPAFLDATSLALVVRSTAARAQLVRETLPPPPLPDRDDGGENLSRTEPDPGRPLPPLPPLPPPLQTQPKRFHGTVTLNTMMIGSSAGKIAEEVIMHLSALMGAKVTITLEIEAEVPGGVPENVVRTVTENARTLKFTSQGFEKE
jgi:hypothetical protein